MNVCSYPNVNSIVAGPPLEKFRKLNKFQHCLVNINAPSDNTYEEIPFVPKELPDQSGIGGFDILSGMFVIPYDRPKTILVAKEDIPGKKSIRCRTQRNGNLPFNRRKRRERRVYHTYLTEAAPVIAAGEFQIQEDMKTVNIQNDSGHYLPPVSVLEYAECLFKQKGYDVIIKPFLNVKLATSRFTTNAKTLSEWSKKPYGKWYEGGKRKTRRRKVK
jgi:hypothetical protein